jgi:hypothetical protein
MKTVSKNLLPDLLTNPISRNLILILLGALMTAVTLVTAAFFFVIG